MYRTASAVVFLVIIFMSALSAAYATDYGAVLQDAKTRALASDEQTAESMCRSIIDEHPGMPYEPRARVLMGYILIRKKSATEMVAEEFRRAAEDFPESPEAAEALHCLGHLALRVKAPLLAVQRFEKSAATLQALPEVAADSMMEAGYAYISQYWKTSNRSHLLQAIERFKRTLNEFSPSGEIVVKVRLGLGEAYLIQGSGKKACEQYQAVLDMQPQDQYLMAVAQFELGCALYAKKDWEHSLLAYDAFLSDRTGANLLEKDWSWKQTRPDYAALLNIDPEKARELSGLELVPIAAYWKAATLFKLQRCQEAKQIADQLLTEFPELTIKECVQQLKSMCAHIQGEVK